MACSLPTVKSAQTARHIALTRACTLVEGKIVTNYTDSKYVFGVCCAVDTIWKSHEFLASADIPTANGCIMANLLQAIHLLPKIAIPGKLMLCL